ncbi:MAG: SDR family oxidoreductase [Bacteroidota bacterium]
MIVITGASAGVGRATAREFAKQGAKLVLLARSIEKLRATKKEIKTLRGQAIAIECDVSNADQVEAAADQAEKEFGQIDVWVNNAMVSVFSPFDEMTQDEFKRVTEVTYLGTVYGTYSALKRMQKRNQGSIVLVGSALAYRGIPLQSAYCGAKHGVQGFFDSLRAELLHNKSNINVSMVQLPALNTPHFDWVLNKLPYKPRPMGKVYQPEVAAKAILFAAAHHRRELFVGYPTFKAIIGDKIAPWLGDWILSRNGYRGQQTNEPADRNGRNNLWRSFSEDKGAHGRFGKVAVNRSYTLWLSVNRALVRIATVLAFAVVAGFLYSTKNHQNSIS